MRTVVGILSLALLGLALMRKRWAYVAFVILSLLMIPSRTSFVLVRPSCDLSPTMAQVSASLGNIPHIVLFACFFIVTVVQFRGALPTRLAGATLITTVFGMMIELEQGATRTGNCELHDLVPNTIGILLGAGLAAGWMRVTHRE